MEKEQVEKLDKVEKTDAEWRAELTPEQYYVMRQRGPSRHFPANSIATMRTARIAVERAALNCSTPTPSSNRVADGPASPCRPMPPQ